MALKQRKTRQIQYVRASFARLMVRGAGPNVFSLSREARAAATSTTMAVSYNRRCVGVCANVCYVCMLCLYLCFCLYVYLIIGQM